jgi:hypothetical protein
MLGALSVTYIKLLHTVGPNVAGVYVGLAFGCFYHVKVSCVANISEQHTAFIIRPEMKSCVSIYSETSATETTSTWCQHPKAEATLTMNHHECLKSVMYP